MAKQKKQESNSEHPNESAENANPAGESGDASAENARPASDANASDASANLENMSLEELRAYLAERERREAGGKSPSSPSGQTSGGAKPLSSAGPRESIAASGDAPRIPCAGSLVYPGLADFSVREALSGKRIFMIGGTGFLGRVMLYMLLKYAPDMQSIDILIRPTHGQTGRDRLEREILESPVFTSQAGDRELFKAMADKKIRVVEGDASRANLGLGDEDRERLIQSADIVLNTAGNVEFNPPVDLSINANAVATARVLEFVEQTRTKRYVHVSTCYVADRQVHRDRSPEEIVSDRVFTAAGNEIRIDVESEMEDCLQSIQAIKKRYESDETLGEYRRQARQEMERIGREDVSDRLIEKTAKNLRMMALREELVREGRERAERINRPNVYTYTKTMAELLVKKAGERGVQYTIVRPSIVETSLQHPFGGWNEGIQGSAPLMYMVYRGHRMLPSLSDEPGERTEATLDIIPVDLVAAGTVLAMCALLKDEAKPIYQLAGGPLETPVTPNRLLNILQVSLRENRGEETQTPFQRFLHNYFQAYPVTKRAYQRFSSPRTVKWLARARERLETFDKRKLPPLGQEIVQRVQSGVERAYQLSLMKTKIFQEFLPFMNHGYPTFENRNAIDLWKRLPQAEQPIFFFNPLDIDYVQYLADLHVDAVFRWVFPVLDKRFKAINSIGKKDSKKGESDATVAAALRAAFAESDMEFSERLYLLRKTAADRLRALRARTRETRKAARAQNAASSGASNGATPAGASFGGALFNREGKAAPTPASEWLQRDLRRLSHRAGEDADPKNLGELSEGFARDFADHVELVSGARVTPDTLREQGSVARLGKHVERWREEMERNQSAGRFSLPEEGVELPDWVQKPTGAFLYELQMWFYRRYIGAEVRGKERIPLNNNNVIVVANHASHLDYGLVWYGLGEYARDMGILAARDYFFDAFWKSTFFSNFLNLIPIERTESGSYSKALKNAIDFLQRGGPLLLFPEGTRSPDGSIQPFRHGLGYLVNRTRADVLPVRLYNTHQALPKGKAVTRRDAEVSMEIGRLIPFEDLEELTEGCSPTKTYAKIAKHLEEAVRSIHPQGAGSAAE